MPVQPLPEDHPAMYKLRMAIAAHDPEAIEAAYEMALKYDAEQQLSRLHTLLHYRGAWDPIRLFHGYRDKHHPGMPDYIVRTVTVRWAVNEHERGASRFQAILDDLWEPLPVHARHGGGHSWGYGGSGPSQLALDLLLQVLGEEPTEKELHRGDAFAWLMHMDYKDEVTARIPMEEPWFLAEPTILAWMQTWCRRPENAKLLREHAEAMAYHHVPLPEDDNDGDGDSE